MADRQLAPSRDVSRTAKGLLRALRPRQWTKNLLVFFGLIFALKLLDWRSTALAAAAFVVFCLVSGAIYLINDLVDVEQDRLHPVKRLRPIASGVVQAPVALIAVMLVLAIALPVGFLLNTSFGLLVVGYLVLMLTYSLVLKHVVLLDVFAIAAGFVIRVVAGAVVIDVPISPWLYVCTVLGAVFLGLGKRRHELELLNDDAANHRQILDEYSPELLDQLMMIVISTTLMAYSLYTFSAENLPDNHSMMLTIPFVLYGSFRYLYLVHLKNEGGSPEEMLLRDRPLLISIGLWLALAIAILYVFR